MAQYSKKEIKLVMKRTKEIERILVKNGIPFTKDTAWAYIIGSNNSLKESIRMLERSLKQ